MTQILVSAAGSLAAAGDSLVAATAPANVPAFAR
jgi:hypothetical protein